MIIRNSSRSSLRFSLCGAVAWALCSAACSSGTSDAGSGAAGAAGANAEGGLTAVGQAGSSGHGGLGASAGQASGGASGGVGGASAQAGNAGSVIGGSAGMSGSANSGGGGATSIGGATSVGGTSNSGGTTSIGGSAGAAGSGGGTAQSGITVVYVGGADGVFSVFDLNAATGALSLVATTPAGDNSTFGAVNPAHTRLYVVNEDTSHVAAFSIDQVTGKLTALNRVVSGGDDPAFVAVDHSGKYVLVANYDGGTVRSINLLGDGSLGTTTSTLTVGGNPHEVLLDPTNRFALVPNLGSNVVLQMLFDPSTGKLTQNTVPSVPGSSAMAGPRHLAFQAGNKYASVINETASSIATYTYDATTGRLGSTAFDTVSTIPADFDPKKNTGAEIVVAPSGHFLYGSNRGHDSIATFAIDASTGKLSNRVLTPCGGKTPRNFTLSEDGTLMLVANVDGNNVVSFRVDTQTGALTLLKTIPVNQASFVGIVSLPGK